MRPLYLAVVLPLLSLTALAQRQPATVVGRVTDTEGRSLPGGSVTILGRATGVMTDTSGRFRMSVPAERPFALVFSHAGHRSR